MVVCDRFRRVAIFSVEYPSMKLAKTCDSVLVNPNWRFNNSTDFGFQRGVMTNTSAVGTSPPDGVTAIVTSRSAPSP